MTADGFDSLRALVDPKRRAGQGRFRSARPRHSAGRWALLRAGVGDGDGVRRREPAGPVEEYARQLLRRWGVVFRDLIVRETLAPPWRYLLRALRTLEARGEIRGGRFVDGFVGEQFARPEAVASLRGTRRDAGETGPPMKLSAADPLNLHGIVLPGPKVSGLSGTMVESLTPAAGEHAAAAS